MDYNGLVKGILKLLLIATECPFSTLVIVKFLQKLNSWETGNAS